MFKFLKNKQKKTNITHYDDAVKVIKTFIANNEFKKAVKLNDIVLKKEYNAYIDSIKKEGITNDEKRINNSKYENIKKELNEIKGSIIKKEIKFNELKKINITKVINKTKSVEKKEKLGLLSSLFSKNNENNKKNNSKVEKKVKTGIFSSFFSKKIKTKNNKENTNPKEKDTKDNIEQIKNKNTEKNNTNTEDNIEQIENKDNQKNDNIAEEKNEQMDNKDNKKNDINTEDSIEQSENKDNQKNDNIAEEKNEQTDNKDNEKNDINTEDSIEQSENKDNQKNNNIAEEKNEQTGNKDNEKIKKEEKNDKKSFISSLIASREKKEIESVTIKNFDDAIEKISFYVKTNDWARAKKAIDEITEKELESYKELIEKIESEPENDLILKEKTKVTVKYKKKQKEIEKLKNKYHNQKEKYDFQIEKQRFTIRFKTIRTEVNHLAKSGKASEGLKLLSHFLEENPGKRLVIDFYNTEKKFILKQLSKEEKIEKEKLKQNAKIEALKLIGEVVDTSVIETKEQSKKEKKSFFQDLKERFNLYKKIKEGLEKRRLIDEISLLIEEEDKVKNDIASAKLENIHKGLVKDIERNNLTGYNLYGKILGQSKISGDTFGFNEIKKKYTFFIGDATGHGIKAGFIITLLTRLFNKFVEKGSLKSLIFEINNGLKQDLKSMNFITGIFFEIFKENPNKINFVGLGHEPLLIYRSKTQEVEKVIPGGLAAGIRMIKNVDDIKVKTIELGDNDIVLTYSDGIVETKSIDGKFYSVDRLKETFNSVAKYETDIKKIYNFLINDAKRFRGGTSFDDDLTILIVKRNINKDIIDDKEKVIEEMGESKTISRNEIKKIKGTTRKEIKEEIEKIKEKKKLERIIRQLEQLWMTGEILKLKSEAKRFIKEGNIHSKINYFLKKAIDNGEKYKISLKEERVTNKFNLMKELLKKGDYNTVIREAEDIISKDGSI